MLSPMTSENEYCQDFLDSRCFFYCTLDKRNCYKYFNDEKILHKRLFQDKLLTAQNIERYTPQLSS